MMRSVSNLIVAMVMSTSLFLGAGSVAQAQPQFRDVQELVPPLSPPIRIAGETLWIGDAPVPLPVAVMGSLGFIGALMATILGIHGGGSSKPGSSVPEWREGTEPSPLTTTVTETPEPVTVPGETVTVTETPEPTPVTATVTRIPSPEVVTTTVMVTNTETASETITDTITLEPETVTQTLEPETLTETATATETATFMETVTSTVYSTTTETTTLTSEVEIPNVIPDVNLRRIINARLDPGRDPEQHISARDMAELRHLDVPEDAGVQSFEGTQFATGLATMVLEKQTQLPDMSGMNELQQIWIMDYRGADLVQRFAALNTPHLRKLELAGSYVPAQLGSILSGRTNLAHINLYNMDLPAVPEELLDLPNLVAVSILAGNPEITEDDPVLQALRSRHPDPVEVN